MTVLLHKVAPGESLSSIARRYKAKPRHLKALNGLSSSKLYLGQTLLVRIGEEEDEPMESKSRGLTDTSIRQHVVKSGETLYRIAINYNIPLEQLKKDNQLKDNTIFAGMILNIGSNKPISVPVSAQTFKTYKVAKGDNLSKIARLHNTDVTTLLFLNGLKITDVLSIGMELKVGITTGGNTFPPVKPPVKPVVDPPVNPPLNPPLDPFQPPVNPGTGNPDLVSLNEDPNFNLLLGIRLLNGESRVFKLSRKDPGYRFAGQSRVVPSHNTVLAVGVSPQIFNALQFCKQVEGHYDAINTYDIGIFSYGFIQFAAKFSLNQLLQSMKTNAPAFYQQTFGKAGIQVNNEQIMVPSAPSGLSQVQIWEHIRARKDMFVPFIQAGYVPELIAEQYRVANQLYAVPSLNAMLTLQLPGGIQQKVPVFSVFQGLELQALAIAMGVNLGPNYMARVLSEALSELIQVRNLPNPNLLANIFWKDICAHLIAFESVPRPDQAKRKSKYTIERAQKIMDSGVPVILT